MDERVVQAEARGATDERLAALLRDLVDEVGRGKAAEQLGVDRKTLWRCLTSGRLTPRMAAILERRLLANEGRERLQQWERDDALERRVEALEQVVREGLASVRESIETLDSTQDQALRQWRAQAAQAGARPARETGAGTPPPPPTSGIGASKKVIGRPAVAPGRVYPQLVTLAPEAGEEMLYGEAMAAVREWRRIRDQHEASASRVERLDAAVRMRELEIVLIGEHELTLSPAVYPWDRFDRRDEVWRREQSLADLRSERRRALALRRLRRVLTLGLWRK